MFAATVNTPIAFIYAAARAALAIPAAAAPAAGGPLAQGRPLALVDPRHAAAALGAGRVVPVGHGPQQVKPVAALGALVVVNGHVDPPAQSATISIVPSIIHDFPV